LSESRQQEALQRFMQRGTPDEGTRRARRRRGTILLAAGLLLFLCAFCLFISILLGVTQSYLGQWWMKPPRYPGAVQVDYKEGEVCMMPVPGAYCYEWFYRTPDTEEQVLDYYTQREWPLHNRFVFEWRKGRRFTTAWVAESCVYILSNISCYQIIVHPSGEGDTEVYILERGAMGDFKAGER
jgi:hypothetical protein